MRRLYATTVVSAAVAFLLPSLSTGAAAQTDDLVNREVEAVVMSGVQFPAWSRLPAEGVGDNSYPPLDRTIRDAHYGHLTVPPDPTTRTGVPVDQVTAFRWEDGDWNEIPVQVDQRFPYFLVNNHSEFGAYSRTDEELTYQWDVESWRKLGGQCQAEYDAALDTSGADRISSRRSGPRPR